MPIEFPKIGVVFILSVVPNFISNKLKKQQQSNDIDDIPHFSNL
tara:strand:- start:213 stop:344 length:132 start_codon:yes stop_codon:yes gene_type:complete